MQPRRSQRVWKQSVHSRLPDQGRRRTGSRGAFSAVRPLLEQYSTVAHRRLELQTPSRQDEQPAVNISRAVRL